MSTEALGRYLVVERLDLFTTETAHWVIKNKKSGIILCDIVWYSPWKRYVSSYTNNNAAFEAQCHRDIAEFLDRVNGNESSAQQAKSTGCTTASTTISATDRASAEG